MEVHDRVADKLRRAFAGELGIGVRTSNVHEPESSRPVEVRSELGRHGEREWFVVLPVSCHPDLVSAGLPVIWGREPGGPNHRFGPLTAVGPEVPGPVRDAAGALRARVEGLDLQEQRLNAAGLTLLDALRDLVAAHALEDEAALAEAAAAGREIVLTYRPSLANALPAPRDAGPRP